MSKQSLWFLTLFSLILVLSVYYITMPNDLLVSNKNSDKKVEEKNNKTTKIEETSSLVAMRVSLEEERQNEMDVLQELLTNDKSTSEEKNNAYEQLKYLNELQGKEEAIEKDNSNANVVCIASKHDSTLANNIMRLVQKSYKNKMFTTVKFQKS